MKQKKIAYNKELDLLVLANNITKSNVEKENSPPYPEDVVMDPKEETMNLEDTTSMTTPHSAMGSSKLNHPTMALGLVHYVHNIIWRCF
jgi:Leucine-rich repeat (LRR) protein